MSIRNFSTFFWKRFEEHKERVAFAEPAADGTVRSQTFWEWTRDVQKLAMGLLDAGFEPGQRLAIAAPSRREWFDIAFATWLNGGVVVPLVPGRDRRETLRCLARAGVEWIAADTHDGLDAVRGQGDKIPPQLRWIAFEKMRVGNPPANTFEIPALIESGKDLLKRGKLDLLAKRTYELDAAQPALVVYPLEPGDDPHGAYYGGGKLAVMLESLGSDLQLEDDDRLAPLLSLGWYYGLFLSLATLLQGRTLTVAATARELEDRFGDLRPTVIACGPAWIEGQARAWRRRIEDAPDFLKHVEATSGPFGLGRALSALGSSAARSILYDPIAKSLGGRVQRVYLAGGTAPDEVLDVLDAAKITVLGAWGLPECGISHVERPGSRERGSVGRPVQGYVCKLEDAKLGEQGEILIRSDVLFDGYWDDEGPREIVDGYLRTGIEGRIESGFLFVD